MKLKIKNFQSIKEGDLDISGFTVLSGPSNVGKSAVLRAFSGALFGIPGEYYVKEGESHSVVEIDFGDLKVKWVKALTGKKGIETSLTIDGNRMTKLGRDQADLLKDKGFLELSSGAFNTKPQVALQFDKLFPLDYPDTVVADLIKVVTRGDVLVRAQGSLVSDLKRLGQEITFKEAKIEEYLVNINGLSGVLDLEIGLQGIEGLLQEVEKINKWISETENLDWGLLRWKGVKIEDIKERDRDLIKWYEDALSVEKKFDLPNIDFDTKQKEFLEILSWIKEHNAFIGVTLKGAGEIEKELYDLEQQLIVVKSSLEFCPICGNLVNLK